MNKKPNQAELMYNYNFDSRPRFNKKLFIRHDDDIINAIKNVILSAQRESSFTIKVLNFEVIDDYDEVNHILWQYEDNIINKTKRNADSGDVSSSPSKKKSSSKTSKKYNQFEYINLNDSDIKLLKVNYYINIVEKKNGFVEDFVSVYIALPRIIDNYYFRINGNIYSAMYQIVDASTYNNSSSANAKKQSVTFRDMFMPIKVYRYSGTLKDISGNPIKCIYFYGYIFRKTLLIMKYVFAKMGFYKTLSFFGLPQISVVEGTPAIYNEDNDYLFPIRDNINIMIPRLIYDNSQVAQSLVYTIHAVVTHIKNATYQTIFDTATWVRSLGAEFTSTNMEETYNKGIGTLHSLEFIYDKGTREDLRLDPNDKDDVYRIIRWLLYEFNALRMKENVDISTKKITYADYIAQAYAAKLVKNIYRLSDKGKSADLLTVKRVIQIPPMYLLNAISVCKLVSYKDCVNDLDAITSLKYTYKGGNGIGGDKANAVPISYKCIHPSHLGRVDLDSSSSSDPGMSGTICPLVQLHDWYFSDFREPSTWEADLSQLLDQYRSLNNKVEMVRLINRIDLTTSSRSGAAKTISAKKEMFEDTRNDSLAAECRDMARELIDRIVCSNTDGEYINGIDIHGDGRLFYSLDDAPFDIKE